MPSAPIKHHDCSLELQAAGRTYPRTCHACGLRGPCLYGFDAKQASRPPAPAPILPGIITDPTTIPAHEVPTLDND